MAPSDKKPTEQLRGASQLIGEATERVTEVVEAMHTTIASGPGVLGKPLAGPVSFVNQMVYGSIRGVSRVVGKTIELTLRAIEPLFEASPLGPEREALVAALNGVVGDHLTSTRNPLAIEMSFRSSGRTLTLDKQSLHTAFPRATGRVLVAIHGSSMNDLQWNRNGHDHAAALAERRGLTPVYLHYNSGQHISTNGHQLSALLEQLCDHWPMPIESLVFLTHSMGGLVARSACVAGEKTRWRRLLKSLFFLGTPHHGAPLERGGNWFEFGLGLSSYSAPLARLAKLRSSGVTDLRFGNVVDTHWNQVDRFALRADARVAVPLPDNVKCYALAATTAERGVADLFGDGLVPVKSALGQHDEQRRTLDFPERHQWIGYGLNHLDLLDSQAAFEQMLEWMKEDA